MTEKLGRYEILEEIGQGGFAIVYRAHDTRLDRLVALKELRSVLLNDPDAVKALRKIAPRIRGQLGDSLGDPRQEFAIRRRIPRVLAADPGQATAEVLMNALRDRRFEVRYRCGQALARVVGTDPKIDIAPIPSESKIVDVHSGYVFIKVNRYFPSMSIPGIRGNIHNIGRR